MFIENSFVKVSVHFNNFVDAALQLVNFRLDEILDLLDLIFKQIYFLYLLIYIRQHRTELLAREELVVLLLEIGIRLVPQILEAGQAAIRVLEPLHQACGIATRYAEIFCCEELLHDLVIVQKFYACNLD